MWRGLLDQRASLAQMMTDLNTV